MSHEYNNSWENRKSDLQQQERMDILSNHVGALRAEVHSLSRSIKKTVLFEKITILVSIISIFLFIYIIINVFILGKY